MKLILILLIFTISCSEPAPLDAPATPKSIPVAPAPTAPPDAAICKVQDEFNEPTYIDDQPYIFKERGGNQIMVFDPCCDKAGTVFIFRNDQVPAYVINRYKGRTYGGMQFQTHEDVKAFIAKKIDSGKEIEKSYFISKKGIKLGMSSSEAAKIYGPPLSRSVIDKNHKITRYTWENYGRVELEGYTGAHVKDGYLYADTGDQPDKETKLGIFCPDVPQGVTIYIDFQPTAKDDEAIFIYMEHHGIG